MVAVVFALRNRCLLDDEQAMARVGVLALSHEELYHMDIESLRKLALAAAASGNDRDWQDWYVASVFILMESDSGVWPELLFNLVLDLLCDQRVLHARNSLDVAKLLADEWDCLTTTQRARLLPVIEDSYSRVRDEFSCFCIAELLGEHFANKDSLEALKRLTGDRRMEARSYVAYGLRLFVENTKDAQLRRIALRHLRAMRADAAPEVRQEVEEGLTRLAKSGLADGSSK